MSIEPIKFEVDPELGTTDSTGRVKTSRGWEYPPVGKWWFEYKDQQLPKQPIAYTLDNKSVYLKETFKDVVIPEIDEIEDAENTET